MFRNPLSALAQAIEDNQKAAERVIKAVDDHMGTRRPKIPDPLKIATDKNFARPA